MNETIKIMKSRRSIRQYGPEQVKEKDLNVILEAGTYAPSGSNVQSWHITAVQNRAIFDRMTKVIKEAAKGADNEVAKRILANPDFRAFHNAPTAILVSGDAKEPYSPANCAACMENMVIAAESLGYGSCWMGGPVMMLFHGKKGQEFMKDLGIPAGYKPFYFMALGYKAEKPTAAPRRQNVINIIR